MIYIRGNAMDFEKWAKEDGLESWDYAHCLPYFKRIENRLVGEDDYHGVDGPLYLTTPECDNPLLMLFQIQRNKRAILTEDVNGYQQEGFGKFDRTTFQATVECGADLPSIMKERTSRCSVTPWCKRFF